MVDEGISGLLDVMSRTMSMTLAPTGGRVFAHHAKPGKLDHQTIELKCQWRDDDWFGGNSVVVGDQKHPRHTFYADDDDDRDEADRRPREEETGWSLTTIPIMLSIYEVDETGLAESAAKHEGDPVFGRFAYNEMVNTGDGVVNDKWPTCSAWISVGTETFRMIRDRVLNFEEYDFKVGIEVLFPAGPDQQSWMGGRLLHWDGKGKLPVTSATAVWMKEDWRSDVRRQIFPKPPGHREEEWVAPREHRELVQATSRIEAAVGKLALPMWLVTCAVVALLIFRH